MSYKNTEIAPVSKRIAAGLIDTGLAIVLFILMALIFGSKVSSTTAQGTASTSLQLTGWPFIVFLGLVLSYYIILEYTIGATLGKYVTGLRILSDSSEGKPNLSQVIQRNLLRVIDGFPFVIPYVLGIIVVASNDKKMRIGDKVAKTVVVVKES